MNQSTEIKALKDFVSKFYTGFKNLSTISQGFIIFGTLVFITGFLTFYYIGESGSSKGKWQDKFISASLNRFSDYDKMEITEGQLKIYLNTDDAETLANTEKTASDFRTDYRAQTNNETAVTYVYANGKKIKQIY